MLNIIPIPALNDNYIWLLSDGIEAVCIDPSDASPVLQYLQTHQLMLNQIWITHHHHDHTGGIAELKQAFKNCVVYGNHDIAADVHIGDSCRLKWGEYEIDVWHSAGHTDTHLSYLLHDTTRWHVFCGDTLFSAGCGRVFTGTIEQLYYSLQKFNELPPETLFYPAHEYTAANLRFAQFIEPNNTAIQTALNHLHTPSLPVSLAHERTINPFLRTHLPDIQTQVANLLKQENLDELQTFAGLRQLKNQF